MKIKYELEEQEAQMVIDSLAELPLKASFNLFMKLNAQLRQQMEPQVAEKPKEVAKKEPARAAE